MTAKKQKSILEQVKKAKLDINGVVNWTIVTSEYQTAFSIIGTIRKIANPLLHSKIEERINELETLAQQELLLAYNIQTRKKELMRTPIYPIDSKLGELLYNYYLFGITDYMSDDTGLGLRDIGLFRNQSDVLYTSNAPIFRVAEFLKHDEYINLLSDESVSNEKITAIHDTLVAVFLAHSSKLNEVIGTGLFDKDTLETLNLSDVVITIS